MKTNNDYCRDKVYEAEHGICQLCGFDAHSLFKQVRLRVLFVLRFFDPVNPMGSCRAWSVYLTHFYWAGLVL